MKQDSKAWQVTSHLLDCNNKEDAESAGKELSVESEFLSIYVYISDDGKYIFFPDKLSIDDVGLNLYFRELADPDAEAVKIDSDVRGYAVNDAATLVTYVKGENLYQYNIADDTKEKIASNISSVEYITEDFSTVYYTKDDSLYKQVIGTDKEKIANDVYDVIKIYDSGEIYYWTFESKEIYPLDFFDDDCQAEDASFVEPNYPDYPDSPSRPSRWDYDTSEEYNAAYAAYEDAYEAWQDECDSLKAEYDADCEVYDAKLSRDELRAELDGTTLEASSRSLCYYDGEKEIVVANDAYTGFDNYSYSYDYAENAPAIVYTAYDLSNLKKARLSDIENYEDIEYIEYMIEEALYSSAVNCIAAKDTSTVIEQANDAFVFRVNPSGTAVYYIDDVQEEQNYGGLYRIPITNGNVGKTELYDSDVFVGYCRILNDDDLLYFKDCKGDMYISKDRIDYDVQIYVLSPYSVNEKFVYFTDWDYGSKGHDGYGTLKVYDGKKSEKIADDVHSAAITPDGRVLYLCDFSSNHYTGELREWVNGETRKIDDDVISLLPFIDSNDRGFIDRGFTYD